MATHILNAGATQGALAGSYDTGTAPSGWSANDILLVPDGTAFVTDCNTAWASISLDYCQIGPECARAIGNAGTNWVIKVDGGSSTFNTFYHFGRGSGVVNATGTTVDVRMSGGQSLVLAGGAITNLYQQENSVVSVGAAPTITNVVKQGGQLSLAKQSGATKITSFTDMGGLTQCARVVDTLRIGSGQGAVLPTFTLTGDAKIDVIAQVFSGSLIVNSRSSTSYEVDDVLLAPFATLSCVGAKFDVRVDHAMIANRGRVVNQRNGVKFTYNELESLGDIEGILA